MPLQQSGRPPAGRPRFRCAPRRLAAAALALTVLACAAAPAAAQHWTFDARRIALGNVQEVTSIASRTVPRRRQYRVIVVPFRLFQILGNLGVYNPNSYDFNPIQAITNIVSPLHATFARAPSGQDEVLEDLLRFDLDDDLGAGDFGALTALTSPGPDGRVDLVDTSWDETYVGEWFFAGNWGRTFTVHESGGGIVHAVYVGAGPYVSFHADAALDGSFRSWVDTDLAIDSLVAGRLDPDVVGVNLRYGIHTDAYAQLAAALTGGYRAHVPFAGQPASSRDGIYVALNYHHLHGFGYEDLAYDFRADLEATAAGVTGPPSTSPLGGFTRLTSRGGRGFAVDAAVTVARGRWDVGVGATGLLNRIDWRDVGRGVLPIFEENLYDGFGEEALDPIRSPTERLDEARRISTPRRYTADAGYHAPAWSALANYAHGFSGHSINAGVEYRFARLAVRGGGRFKRDRWHPTGGVGFRFSSRWHVDAGVFGTSINPSRRRELAVAVSLRME